MSVGLGGLAFGFIQKQFPNLPSIPVVGKTGTITAIAYFFAKRGGGIGGIARDVAIAGAALSGYQLGLNGKISGELDGIFDEV